MEIEASEFGRADPAVEETAHPTSRRALLFQRVDGVIGTLTEAAAAALVVAETVLLGASTTARYVFSNPLTWSDELASVLFLWLAMLGAVIAPAARRAHAAHRIHPQHAPRAAGMARGGRPDAGLGRFSWR